MPWDLDDLQENEEFAPVPPSEVARLEALQWTLANRPGDGSRVFPFIPCEMEKKKPSECVPVDDESDPAVLPPAGFSLSTESLSGDSNAGGEEEDIRRGKIGRHAIVRVESSGETKACSFELDNIDRYTTYASVYRLVRQKLGIPTNATPVSIRLEYDNGHELPSRSDHFVGHMLNGKTLRCMIRNHSYATAPLTESLPLPQSLDRNEPRLTEPTEFDDDTMAVVYSESRKRCLDSATPLDVIPETRHPFKLPNLPLSNVGSDTKNDSTGNVGSSTDSGTQLPEARLSFDQAIPRP